MVEQPIRNRQVASSTLALGSIVLQLLKHQSVHLSIFRVGRTLGNDISAILSTAGFRDSGIAYALDHRA
ncbi:MAG: hypothetical protein QOJ41_369, partial [Acidobacteriaceae bacterium]|nr:hypothetical protein [Acidobacteriaceae bacterium]